MNKREFQSKVSQLQSDEGGDVISLPLICKKTIRFRSIKKKRIVGYCTCSSHPGWLSKDEADTHECFQKGCSHLMRVEGHPYWHELEAKKKQKQKNKKSAKMKKKEQKQGECLIQEITELAQKEIARKKYEIDIVYVGKAPGKRNVYILNYASDKPFNDSRCYEDLYCCILRECSVCCWIRRAKNLNQEYLTRAEWAKSQER